MCIFSPVYKNVPLKFCSFLVFVNNSIRSNERPVTRKCPTRNCSKRCPTRNCPKRPHKVLRKHLCFSFRWQLLIVFTFFKWVLVNRIPKFVYMISLKLNAAVQEFLQKLSLREKTADIIRGRGKRKLCLIILKLDLLYYYRPVIRF